MQDPGHIQNQVLMEAQYSHYSLFPRNGLSTLFKMARVYLGASAYFLETLQTWMNKAE